MKCEKLDLSNKDVPESRLLQSTSLFELRWFLNNCLLIGDLLIVLIKSFVVFVILLLFQSPLLLILLINIIKLHISVDCNSLKAYKFLLYEWISKIRDCRSLNKSYLKFPVFPKKSLFSLIKISNIWISA
ncbi:hypothetical protein FRA_34c05870 [Francisella sp. W12-1067]|nr:hypothetical protein FRA_34c05870 [Francisella sp. W12-1067]